MLSKNLISISRERELNGSPKKGFTLIELLVVIAIIGLLSSIVLVSMQGMRGKARDATRRAGLRQVQLALELYYSNYEIYPSTGSVVWVEGKCVNPPPSWGWVIKPDYSGANAYIPNLAPGFMDSLPGDPAVNGINGRCYGYWSNGTKYFIWAHLGVESPYSADDPMIRLIAPGCTTAQNTFFKAEGFTQCF